VSYPGSRSHAWVAGERVDHDVLNAWGPQNVAWGNVLAPVTKTSAQGSITSVVDIASLSITFTAEANRRYCIRGRVLASAASGASVNNEVFELYVTDGSNGVIGAAAVTDATGNGGSSLTVTVEGFTAPGAGSVTYKLRGARLTGTATWQAYADSVRPAFIAVFDAGPSTP
jgi:hypothetical protein